MLTIEENDLLTQTDRGTPAGEFMRRYWQPAALSDELPEDGPPVPVRLMGEDLVLFREPSTSSGQAGRPGLLGIHCSHRGADLSYGRLEDGGLRCIYHGWLYDLTGRCLEQPGEPAGSTFHERIQPPAYPCTERNGVIFAYLGPGEPPLLPAFDFLTSPSDHVIAMKLFTECNYLQGNEGNIDLIHLSYLHWDVDRNGRNPTPNGMGAAPDVPFSGRGAAPHLETVEAELTPFGLRVCKIRDLGADQDLYVGTFALPSFFCFGGYGDTGYSLNWHVPIDDTHHWKYTFRFRRDGPYDRQGRGRGGAEKTADYRPVQNMTNRYMQDRESMKTHSYTGILTVNQPQDLCVIEGAGPLQDRTQEHLGSYDAPITASRQLILKGIRDVQEDKDPPGVVRHPEANRFPYVLAHATQIPKTQDWRAHMKEQDTKQYASPIPAAV